MVLKCMKGYFRLLGFLYWDRSARGKTITLALNCFMSTVSLAYILSLIYNVIFIAAYGEYRIFEFSNSSFFMEYLLHLGPCSVHGFL